MMQRRESRGCCWWAAAAGAALCRRGMRHAHAWCCCARCCFECLVRGPSPCVRDVSPSYAKSGTGRQKQKGTTAGVCRNDISSSILAHGASRGGDAVTARAPASRSVLCASGPRRALGGGRAPGPMAVPLDVDDIGALLRDFTASPPPPEGAGDGIGDVTGQARAHVSRIARAHGPGLGRFTGFWLTGLRTAFVSRVARRAAQERPGKRARGTGSNARCVTCAGSRDANREAGGPGLRGALCVRSMASSAPPRRDPARPCGPGPRLPDGRDRRTDAFAVPAAQGRAGVGRSRQWAGMLAGSPGRLAGRPWARPSRVCHARGATRAPHRRLRACCRLRPRSRWRCFTRWGSAPAKARCRRRCFTTQARTTVRATRHRSSERSPGAARKPGSRVTRPRQAS